MKNLCTPQQPTKLYLKKLMVLALFIYIQTIAILPALSQDPIVTNSTTYDVFMNLDPSRGLNPTTFSDDVSTYLNTLGAPVNSYRILTSAVTLDPTDVTKWEVYDHYDAAWYANEAEWSASPGGFNNGNIPSNWYYYGVSDVIWSGYNSSNSKITIAQLLDGQGTWGYTGTLQSHIYPFVENGKPAMQFYGYSQIAAADFLYYPADVASTKTVKFDVDAQKIDTHTLTAAGFLINGGTSGTGASKTISGYLLLIDAYLTNVKIYKLNNVNVNNLHNSGTGALGTLVATYSSTIYSKSHIELSITSTALTATIQQLDASGNLTGSKSTMFNSQELTNTGFGGFGPFVLYSSHSCWSASAFRFSNLEMAFGGVLSGSSSLEAYQYAQYLYNSTNRFFVNLTNTSQTNYLATANDIDNAYLQKIEDDKVVFITDESAGTYLPGTLNENIKNITNDPSDAVLATALGLADLSSLTSAQQLAAKTAYLILNTALGSYGTISSSTTTAVASLMLLDGPGTDASWTGAKQVNEIESWLIGGTSINIYLKSDMGINTTGLTETYELKNPSGTITTITTSNDNGKEYFTFPKASATGEYSVTLSYASGGSITTTVPATEIFNFAPIPALDGNPIISGEMKYGQILTVTPNISSVPGITGTLSYQWKANGTNISGATGSTYTLTANEVGKTITCDITSNAQPGTKSAAASGTVSKITLSTVTVSAVDGKTYNGTTATTGGIISFSGTVNSENPTCNATIVWSSSDAGTSTVNVSGLSLTSLSDRYDLSATSLSNVTPANNAKISKATLTVTGSAVASKTYDGSSTAAISGATLSGKIGSDDVSLGNSTSGTFNNANVGNEKKVTSTMTISGSAAGNYNLIQPTLTGNINAKSVTITGVTAISKVYDGTTSATLSGGTVNTGVGTETLTITAGTGTFADKNVGTKAVTASGFAIADGTNGGLASNYSLSAQPVIADQLITSKLIDVTADTKTKIFGEADPDLTYTFTPELVEGDAFTGALSRTPGENAGNYSINSNDLALGNNYTLSYTPADLIVSKATLTVTADGKEKVYGSANPALTFRYNGFVANDDETVLDTKPIAATTITDNSSAGLHSGAITVGGGTDNNYQFSYLPADFNISKANLTATAENKTKVYGESNPELTFTYTGFVNGDDGNDIDVPPTISTEAGTTSPVGVYPVMLAPGSDNNYLINCTDGSLIVTKAALTATADSKSKTYSEANPELTVSYAGFVNGDDASSLDVPPVPSTEATVSSDAGSYPVTLSPGSDDNYEITNIDGNLAVNKAVLKVTADDKSRTYGQPNPELTLSFSGFVNGDGLSAIDAKPSAFTFAGPASDAGSYEIFTDGGSDNNYSFTYQSGVLEIMRADQTITFQQVTSVLRTTQSKELVATATSGLPVSFESSRTDIVEINGNTMTVLKEGSVTITANQSGNQNYNPAAMVAQTIETLPTFDNIRSLFTPNNDGMNDNWYIPDMEKYGTISVQVYNRYGMLVYESSAYENDWDGTYNGRPLPEASYYYIIRTDNAGIIKGVVNIVR